MKTPEIKDQYWHEDGNWKMIMTSEQFMELFNFYVYLQEKGEEFFRKGCRALLDTIQNHKMLISQNQLNQLSHLLTTALFLDSANPLSFAQLRKELCSILYLPIP